MRNETTANTVPVKPRRVRIIESAAWTLAGRYPGAPLADPHPERVGKEGYLVRIVPGHSPLIRLDDGTELWGRECWWEYVEANQ